MALGHLSGPAGWDIVLYTGKRLIATLCKVCSTTHNSDGLLRVGPSPRSKSLNKESTCLAVIPYTLGEATVTNCSHKMKLSKLEPEYSDIKMISVMNLMSLLKAVPASSEEFSRIVDTFYDKSGTLRQSFRSEIRTEPSQSSGSLDGQYLDHLFGLDKEDTSLHINLFSEVTNDGKNGSPPNYSDSYTSNYFPVSESEEMSFLENFLLGKPHFKRHVSDNTSEVSFAISEPSSYRQTPTTQCLAVTSSHVTLCSTPTVEPQKTPEDGERNRPNQDELRLMQDYLNNYIPNCFKQRHDYRIYTNDVIFENNFHKQPYTINGLSAYVRDMAKYRIFAHMRFANVRMQIIKSTIHEEDGTVLIRWRVSGIPQSRAFMFWKFLPWKYGSSKDDESEWLDGFSIFYIQGSTGLIYKHRLDKVIPDEDLAADVVKKSNLNVGGAV